LEASFSLSFEVIVVVSNELSVCGTDGWALKEIKYIGYNISVDDTFCPPM
jgi:hypothetical protein